MRNDGDGASRILCLRGSPRAGGNSDQLADAFCRAAREAGAGVTSAALRDLAFSPSGAPDDGTADELTPVLEALYEADVLVLSTPVYFCNVTGLLKVAIDRFFGFLKPDYLTAEQPSRLTPGKSLVLLQVQGEPEARYGDLLAQYGPAFDKLGFGDRHLVRACGVREPGDIQGLPGGLEEAAALARDLRGGNR